MSLYGNVDKAQSQRIGILKEQKVDKNGGEFIPPTKDPHTSGALWNNAGTLTISAG